MGITPDRPRSGRPPITTVREDRQICMFESISDNHRFRPSISYIYWKNYQHKIHVSSRCWHINVTTGLEYLLRFICVHLCVHMWNNKHIRAIFQSGTFLLLVSMYVMIWLSGKLPFECQKIAQNLTFFSKKLTKIVIFFQ